jgi:hypothetical protein
MSPFFGFMYVWNAYRFICGLALLAGINFELLWVRFTDIMYIPWSFVL